MSPAIVLATAVRVLRQLLRDHRTVALLLMVPVLLLTLLRFMYDGQPQLFDAVGLVMLGVIPFMVMFLVTSIAMLRERTSGTLERMLTTPLAKLDLLLGYGIAFAVAAAAQATAASAVAYGLLGLDTAGGWWLVLLVAVVNAILGVSLGLLCSAFSQSEFQAVQFLPLVAFPQLFLCGLFVPREQMVGWLQAASDVLPLTYSVRALREIGSNSAATTQMWGDVALVAAVALLALGLAAGTLRRRTR
jgi:ABC-2 type transport system permease protein